MQSTPMRVNYMVSLIQSYITCWHTYYLMHLSSLTCFALIIASDASHSVIFVLRLISIIPRIAKVLQYINSSE